VTELGDVICHYGLHDVVGVTLLHKHFEIADDEIVVDRPSAAAQSRRRARAGLSSRMAAWFLARTVAPPILHRSAPAGRALGSGRHAGVATGGLCSAGRVGAVVDLPVPGGVFDPDRLGAGDSPGRLRGW
jgi:hypothetical protein